MNVLSSIKEGNSPVSITTRFAYKSMITSVGFGALCAGPKGETILFHSDVLNKSNFIIPKRIMWNEVEFLATWHFANVISTLKQRSDKMNRLFYTQMGVEIWFSPTLLDILATQNFIL